MTSSLIMLQAAASGGGATAAIVQMAPLVLVFVAFWFLLIRPQQQRAKAHAAKIEAVKKGDQVITGGGLLGKVTKVSDGEVEVELATGVKVRAVKSTLADIVNPTTSAAND